MKGTMMGACAVRASPHWDINMQGSMSELNSRSVSSTDHGVLRGPICDVDRGLWSLLPGPDHAGGDLRRAMEVIALGGAKSRKPRRGVGFDLA